MSVSSKPKGNLNTGPQATTTHAAETGEAPVGNADPALELARILLRSLS